MSSERKKNQKQKTLTLLLARLADLVCFSFIHLGREGWTAGTRLNALEKGEVSPTVLRSETSYLVLFGKMLAFERLLFPACLDAARFFVTTNSVSIPSLLLQLRSRTRSGECSAPLSRRGICLQDEIEETSEGVGGGEFGFLPDG